MVFDGPGRRGATIEGVFGLLDQREKDSGKVGILTEPNDREGNILMAVAVGLCRQINKNTIRTAASRGYRIMRALYGLSNAPEK